MRPRRRRIMLLLCLLAVFAGAGVFLFQTARSPMLLANATRVEGVPDAPKSLWLSAEELLLLYPAPVTNPAHIAAYPTLMAERYNVETKQITPCDVLSRELTRAQVNGEMYLSPDCKTLLWTALVSPRKLSPQFGLLGYTTEAVALDGSLRVERRGGAHMAWTPDSQGWTQIARRDGVLYAEQQTLASPNKTIAPIQEPLQSGAGTRPLFSRGLSTEALVGRLQDGSLLYVAWPVAVGKPLTLCHIATNPAMPSRLYSVNLPVEGGVIGLAVSPQGNRLAWNVTSTHKSWLDQGLLGWLPPAWRSPRSYDYLYISNTDGSRMRLIGSNEYTTYGGRAAASANAGYLSDMMWMPDGRRLSFRFFPSRPPQVPRLYTIAADPPNL